MAHLPHLILPRAEVDLPRRKRPGFGQQTPRNIAAHSAQLSQAVEQTLTEHRALRSTLVDPKLIIRVKVTNSVQDEDWQRAGLIVLGRDDAEHTVLFSSDGDLKEFRSRLNTYSAGPPSGQTSPSYAPLFSAIDEIRSLTPQDRIGNALKNEGWLTLESFEEHRSFVLDVELWEIGTQPERRIQADLLERQVADRGGEIPDRYIGRSFTVLRILGNGKLFQWLLTLPSVRSVDLPPHTDPDVEQLLETGITDIGAFLPPAPDAPLIAILDSGINHGHPLLTGVVIDELAEPQSLGLNDAFGHGTKVGGIAAYGDVRACLESGSFQARVRLMNGKVVNDHGNFDDRALVPSQMDKIIRGLHARGCRIFNISLGDHNARYIKGRVGTWTAILDELARELDILIVVSAGNYNHVAPTPEDHLLGYPGYLLCEESRLFEPAIAANVLAVGAVAGASALENRLSHNVSVRPIANVGEPAPFTRGGPGIGGAIKPDLCDDGGNICFDGTLQMVSRRPESEILTMHPNYLDRLFTTVQGTSHAAPLVAHKAGLVLQSFPDASANLLRALLATSAKLPEPSVRKLAGLGKQATRNLCGYGIANPTLASTSEPNRVVLYADADIGMDKFLVYEVPMPANFTQTDGSREIRVTLAFDPPTRHTRAAYLGVAMSFRLIRGRTLEQVIEHFRQRNVKTDGLIPDFDNRYNCKFDLGPKVREPGTLQSACFRMAQNPNPQYGETYYLMVRCQRKWMPDDLAMQRFALVVQLTHEADINVYEHVRNRARVRLRA